MAGAIAWLQGGADVFDAALAKARAGGRSVFLYWGAAWCPPCNRVKADLFAHDDVSERVAGLVPVWIDGDAPGAQALAERLKLRSYPTLVLYTPGGAEITRLPCEVDGATFAALLDAALDAPHHASASLAAALAGDRTLADEEWALLAHYAWDTDEGALLQGRDAHAVLAALAQACPVPGSAARLRLHTLVLRADPSAAGWLLDVCRDPGLATANRDLFVNHGNLVRQSGDAAVAAALFDTAQAWADDMWASHSDRLLAVRLQMRMARLGHAVPGMPERVRTAVRDALAGAASPYERHTLTNTAYSALNDAGLHDEAQALLQAELPASVAPYYLMLYLAAGARRRGDTAALLDWYERAWQAAPGKATALQWGVTYMTALLDAAAPADRIERAADSIATRIAANPEAFRQRNRVQLTKLATTLQPTTGPRTATLLATLQANL